MRKKIATMLLTFAFVLGTLVLGSAAEKKVVKLAHYFDALGGIHLARSSEWLWGIIADYEKDFPEVKVEQELFQWNEIDTKMIVDYIAGIPHDVTFSTSFIMPTHSAAGNLLNLTPYIAKWSEKERKEFNWSGAWWECVIDGAQLGIPTGVHARAVVYRRDMFKEVGLDPDKAPKSLDELTEYAKLLTRDTDKDGEVDVWGLGMYMGPLRSTAETYFSPFVWNNGGEIWDPKMKKATFASEAGVKAAKFLYDLIYTYKVTPKWATAGNHDDVIMRSFLAGKYGMAWGWGNYWLVPLQEKGWIEGCIPATPQGRATTADIFVSPTKPGPFVNAWCLSIQKLSQHEVESFKLIEYILRPEVLRFFPDGGLPARMSDYEKEGYDTDFYKKWADCVANGRAWRGSVHDAELKDRVAMALQDILTADAPIEKTLKKSEDEFNAKYAGE